MRSSKGKVLWTFNYKLIELVMKIGNYKMQSNHTMKQHLREMKRMIRKLKTFEHILTDEQQVEAIIKSSTKELGTHSGKHDT